MKVEQKYYVAKQKVMFLRETHYCGIQTYRETGRAILTSSDVNEISEEGAHRVAGTDCLPGYYWKNYEELPIRTAIAWLRLVKSSIT